MLTLQVDKPRHTEVTVIQPGFLDSQGCALQGDFLPPAAVSTRRAWAPRCTPPCPAWESPRAEDSGDALHGIPLTRLPGPLTSSIPEWHGVVSDADSVSSEASHLTHFGASGFLSPSQGRSSPQRVCPRRTPLPCSPGCVQGLLPPPSPARGGTGCRATGTRCCEGVCFAARTAGQGHWDQSTPSPAPGTPVPCRALPAGPQP